MRVAVYVRVSTSRQVKPQTIEQQLERVRRHAREKGWELPDENVFRDDGYSGTILGRPGLDALRDRVRARDLEVVVVLSPDRLARNYVHQMVLIEELEKSGCKVEFVERPMSSEPNDQLLLQIRGAVAEYERTLLSERMRRGRLAKYKAGLLLPWTHTPYGYRVDPDRPRDPAGVRPDEATKRRWSRRSSRCTSKKARACSGSLVDSNPKASPPREAGRSEAWPRCAGYSPTPSTPDESTPAARATGPRRSGAPPPTP